MTISKFTAITGCFLLAYMVVLVCSRFTNKKNHKIRTCSIYITPNHKHVKNAKIDSTDLVHFMHVAYYPCNVLIGHITDNARPSVRPSVSR